MKKGKLIWITGLDAHVLVGLGTSLEKQRTKVLVGLGTSLETEDKGARNVHIHVGA